MKKLATKHRARPNGKLSRHRRPRKPVKLRNPLRVLLPVRGKTVHLAGPGQFTTACSLWIERKAHRLPTSADPEDVTCANCRRAGA